MASLTTAADKSRPIEIPSPQVARFCETSFPQSATALACVSFLCRETAPCVRLELDRPSFANEPLVERCGLAFDRTNPDPPVLVVGVRPLVLAANGTISNVRDQSIPRRNPARPDVAAVVEARLVDFGCIDTVQPINRAIQLERIAISNNNFGRQAWPDHRKQQRRNESAHEVPSSNWIFRPKAEVGSLLEGTSLIDIGRSYNVGHSVLARLCFPCPSRPTS